MIKVDNLKKKIQWWIEILKKYTINKMEIQRIFPLKKWINIKYTKN